MSSHTESEQNFDRMRQLAAQLARSVYGPAPTGDNVKNWTSDFATLEKVMKLYTAKNAGTTEIIKNVSKAMRSWDIYKRNPNAADKRIILDSLTAVSNARYVKPS